MPFTTLQPDSWRRLLNRVLINGPPNTRKTTSLLTWPRPIHIVSYPGEKGASTIPADEPGVHAHVYEMYDPAKVSPATVVHEVKQLTVDILTGKHGEVKTFAGDGLHKLYEVIWDKVFQSLTLAHPEVDEEKLVPRAYGEAHKEFMAYLTTIYHSTVPYAVFSCWEGEEKDDPQSKQKDGPTHTYPDLPGKLAKRIMGEFAVVVFAKVGLAGPNGVAPATWQIQRAGRVWGAGVKAPPAIASKLPPEVPQHWGHLEKLLLGAIPSKPTTGENHAK